MKLFTQKLLKEINQANDKIFWLWLFGIIAFRIFLEIALFSSKPGINLYLMIFHYCWYLCVFLSLGIFLHWFTKAKYKTILRFLSLGSIVLYLPIIQAVLWGQPTDFSFIYGTWTQIVWRIITFSFTYEKVNVGMSIELLILFFGLILFAYYHKQSVLKSVLTGVIGYGVIIALLWGAQPNWIYTTTILNWEQTSYIVNDFSLIKLPTVLHPLLFIYTLQLLFLLLVIIGLFYYTWPEKSRAFWLNIRLKRLILFFSFTLLGVAYAGTFNFYDVLLAGIIYLLIWIYAISINDIYDYDIDAISNKERPLVTGIIKRRELFKIAVLAITFAWLLAMAYETLMLLIVLFSTVVGIVYSVKGWRLRNNLWGSVLSTASQSSNFLIGYIAVSYAIVLPVNIWLKFLLLCIASFLTFQAKDLKDYEGDKKAGVKNLLTIFNYNKGKRVIAIGMFLGILLTALLVRDLIDIWRWPLLYLVAIIFASAQAWYINHYEKPAEKIFFGIAFLYFIVLFLMIL